MSKYIPYNEIGKYRKTAKHYMWLPSPNANHITAASRISSGEFVNIHTDPKFQLSDDIKVFSIGSCFAREIEDVLQSKGVDVLTKGLNIDSEYYTTKARPNAALNKYSTHSIESEVIPAILGEDMPDDGIVKIEDGLYFDPRASHIKPNSKEVILDIRRKIRAVNQKVIEADLIFITLGQNECWYDQDRGIFLNAAPPPQAMRKYKDRWLVSFPDCAENMESIKKTMKCILEHSKKETKIILTVSPIPMGVTLDKADVILSNMYSKSVLRVCAQEVASGNANIDYFPSYEMAMCTPRSLVWERDEAHIKKSMVANITHEFLERYWK